MSEFRITIEPTGEEAKKVNLITQVIECDAFALGFCVRKDKNGVLSGAAMSGMEVALSVDTLIRNLPLEEKLRLSLMIAEKKAKENSEQETRGIKFEVPEGKTAKETLDEFFGR